MKEVIMYTDGACKGNPGIGGWGVVIEYKDRVKELYAYQKNTTNNRMELLAVIEGLKIFKESVNIKLISDSKYVIEGINSWLSNWKNNNWRTASKQPVKNVDLWKQLDEQIKRHQIEWCWIKGHSGDAGNERADKLANLAIEEKKISNTEDV